jgi:16S rRNA (guanine966-N2)-methyltransferase
VIAGEKGGRRLLAPRGKATRPTSDRVREAAFSMLESQGVLNGARVWDLFAGSGAMGIEALSRGAAHVTFVDQARDAVSATKGNLARLGYGPERASVVVADALKWVHGLGTDTPAAPGDDEMPGALPPEGPPPEQPPSSGGPSEGERVDLVLADPPYAWQAWAALLEGLAPRGPMVLIETGQDPELPGTWEIVRAKRYGGTLVTLARLRDGGCT